MKKFFVAFSIPILLLFSLSAQGASLLSNLGNTTDGDYGGAPDSADHFQTGSEALNVTAINILWETLTGAPGVNQVLIYRDVGGFPGTTTVGTPFTNPAVTTAGLMEYTGKAQLAPNTVYWMLVDISDASDVAFTGDDSFVANPSTGGAEMLPGSVYGDDQKGTWEDDTANLKYEIVGEGDEFLYQIGPEMSASFYDLDFEGSGINTEILTAPTVAKDGEKGDPGLVVVYLYSFDIFGEPIFAFGVGTYVENTMTVELLIDYDATGPFWGPGWDPDDFGGLPFVDLVIEWADCGNGVAILTMDPAFLATNPGWASYTLNLTRITNLFGLPTCS